MKKYYLKIYLVLTFIMIIIGCENQSKTMNKEAEIKEITRVVSSCIGWFENKDFDLLFSVVAHDSNYISVHPTDRVLRGYNEFVKSAEFFKNPDFTYVRHELIDMTVNISKSGDVAWYYCILNDINDYKGQPANWENARWTGVVEKRDGQWVIVQQHFSFAQK